MKMLLLLAFGIGFVAGMRSMTAPAVVAWATHLGWLHLEGSALGFIGSTAAVTVLSCAAVGELIADKLPFTPKRTAPAPLIARILMGAFCGACLCAARNYSLAIGAVLGGLGGTIGAFAGYEIRRRLVTTLRMRDIFVAIPEDLIAIGLALALVSR